MLLHRVSPCAQEEAIPEEVPPQVEGMEEEEEEAVQEASEAKVRGAEERQLVSTVENAGAATPLAAAATPFAAAAPAAHNGKAPLRPKSLAAISDQPATALTAAHAGVPMLADAVSAASGDVGREATAHEAAAAPPSHAPLPMADFPALFIPAAPAAPQSSPQAELTAETATVMAQQLTAAAENAAQQAAVLNAWLAQHSAPHSRRC